MEAQDHRYGSIYFTYHLIPRGRKTIWLLHIAFAECGNRTLAACTASECDIHFSIASRLNILGVQKQHYWKTTLNITFRKSGVPRFESRTGMLPLCHAAPKEHLYNVDPCADPWKYFTLMVQTLIRNLKSDIFYTSAVWEIASLSNDSAPS